MSDRGLIVLHALTSLHPGTGTALDVVDLPVHRERHTRWPLIPGSAIKGVLRDRCRAAVANGGSLAEADRHQEVVRAFGPPGEDRGFSAGSLSFTDARLVAFPVRSMRGVFAWITCPAVLVRMNRDLALAGFEPLGLPASTPAPGKALVKDRSPLLLPDGGGILLEEFHFECSGDTGALGAALARFSACDEATHKRMEPRLVVLSDDDFTHFVEHATEIAARVALDYTTKTVKDGALFYQEFLPPECLFYSVVFSAANRAGAQQSLGFLGRNIPAVIQIGGDETTGKGLCAVRLVLAEAAA